MCVDFIATVFTKYRSFYLAMKHNVGHAKKALHLLYRIINHLHLPIDLQIHLFDRTILPILLYGCAVWCFQNSKLIDIVHDQFLRNIKNLCKKSPEYMVYAEWGRYPINTQMKSRAVGFWFSLVNGTQSKISRKLYEISLSWSNNGQNFKWKNYIKRLLISVV